MTRPSLETVTDRPTAALVGLAIGDALGMPTQSMSRERIATTYGPVTGLRDAVADQPIAPSMRAGPVTDDTEQAVLVARLLMTCRRFRLSVAGHVTWQTRFTSPRRHPRPD